MSSLQTSSLLFPSSSSSSSSTRVKSTISVPKLPSIQLPNPKTHSKASNFLEELTLKHGITITHHDQQQKKNEPFITNPTLTNSNSTVQLYAILEAVADRIEMHQNVGVQRDNWNKLLLNSTNMMILTATTMTGVAATCGDASPLALSLSSTVLFGAATAVMLIMSKIQPSQLAEEQRNATRLFKQLYNRIQTKLVLNHNLNESDVKDAMKKVLALDEAFPLPLLGKMIRKFPSEFEAPIWWPKSEKNTKKREGKVNGNRNRNGWNEELESEMREIARVIKGKDSEDYMKLGNIALKVNKILAVSGPLLTGLAAAGAAFSGNGGIVAAAAGALACTVNTLEHGGQVGMVVELYRNCAGIFSLMEETIESTLEESDDMEKIENGEMFEMNLGLQLGRSPSQLRDFARKSSASRRNGSDIDEFASKLF